MKMRNSIRTRLLNLLGIFTDNARIHWVAGTLQSLPAGTRLLDVGAGSQQFRQFCNHLEYFAQDFGESTTGLGDEKLPYTYGPLDFKGNCWEIKAPNGSFDYVLCTEVLEHVPYPGETIREIARLLRPGGRLILSIPCHSLRHMDPYWYFPGFSDRWLTKFLSESGFTVETIQQIGSYSAWMRSEIFRSFVTNKWSLLFLWPALLYFRFLSIKSKRMQKLESSLVIGYHVVAQKQSKRATTTSARPPKRRK